MIHDQVPVWILNKGDQATIEVQTEPTSEQDWTTGTAHVSNEVLEYQTKRYVFVAGVLEAEEK